MNVFKKISKSIKKIFKRIDNKVESVIEEDYKELKTEDKPIEQEVPKIIMHITSTKFYQVFPNAEKGIYEVIAKHIESAGCKTQEQQAMFLAQCGLECGGYRTFVESLNYSIRGLINTFPTRITSLQADTYGRTPTRKADQVMIGNIVYANRMGNGDAKSGDGYKYRGRGLIQITGKYNYQEFARWLGNNEVVTNPDVILTDKDLLVKTAVWYWTKHKLYTYFDITRVTKLINGGTHGLQERRNYYHLLLK